MNKKIKNISEFYFSGIFVSLSIFRIPFRIENKIENFYKI